MSTYLRTPVLPACVPQEPTPSNTAVEKRRWCTPQLVTQAALNRPRAIALKFGDRSMTYAELDERSNHLAAHLSMMGVGPDVPVAICIERSFDLVVSALAILKAGGAYVPLDPAWPLENRDRIIKHSGTAIAVSRAIYGTNARMLVDVDRDWFWLSQSTTHVLPDRANRNRLACILYSAEPGGSPKGVELTHANLLNLIFWQRESLSISTADRSGALADPGSPEAVSETWPFLTAGASVALAGDHVFASPEKLQDWIVREGITVSSVPALLAEPLIAASWPDHSRLRCLFTGPEKLRRAPRLGLPFKIIQAYGSAESSGVAAWRTVPPAQDAKVLAPLGNPAANTKMYVLDQNLQRVVPGSTGEICIAGAGVARGYRNKPVLTGTRFVRDPFSASSEARMYRTGHLGWLLPDGEIALMGKIEGAAE